MPFASKGIDFDVLFFQPGFKFLASSCCVLVVKPEKNVTAYAL